MFFKTTIELEREDRAETLSYMWMGSNLQYKGIKEVIDALQTRHKEPTVQDVNKDWKRLASFMTGVK